MIQRIFEIGKKHFNGEYGRIVTAAVDMITEVEEAFQFDSGVKRVYVWPFKESGDYLPRETWVLSSTVGVPDHTPDSRSLREFVYHELGHAICDGFDIRSHLKPFIRKPVRRGREYSAAVAKAANYRRLPGFVSGYARLDREEDFCETLAAYLCNRRTWRRQIWFAGDMPSVKDEPRLLRRLEAVHQVMRELKRYG